MQQFDSLEMPEVEKLQKETCSAKLSIAPPNHLMPSSPFTPSAVEMVLRCFPGGSWVIRRISSHELKRKSWHIAPGFIPFIIWRIIGQQHFEPLTRIFIALGIAVLFGGVILHQSIYLVRDTKERFGPKVFGFIFPILLAVVLFPNHIELSMVVLASLAFGDGFSTWGALLFRGPALPWNAEKHWSGTVSFFICSTITGAYLYYRQVYPTVNWRTAFLCALIPSFFAAIAESLPMKLNDNLRAGLVALLLVFITQSLLLGLP